MADFLSREARSERMSRIRGRDTKPELLVRRYLHSAGFRFRLHAKDLAGRPDIVLPKYGVVIFVNGCFWHAHSCQKGRIPAERAGFWAEKFKNNLRRDEKNRRHLRKEGWRVLTVWECSLSTVAKSTKELDRLARKILASPRKHA
jgi:DNA mismatch endonuclease (patch repair protein)